MKKFSLPLVVLLLFIAPVFSQQSVPQESTSQDITSQDAATPQNDAAPQTDAQPASAPAAPLGAPASPEDKVIEEIVARVNNAIITRADLRRNLEQISFDTKEQNLSQGQIEERKANALRDLIDQQLLIQRAAELGITADADLVKRLDDIRKQMKVETLEELQKAAEKQGVHWEEFKQNTKNNILTQKVIGSEVGARIQVTHEEAQKYYDEHKADFTQPERVRLSEILIANDATANKGAPLEGTPEQVAAAEAKAKEIYTQLKSGTSFDELARKESNGPTADQGGDLGYFKRNDLAKTLEDETFKLKAGEFTPVIHTRQGFIILQVSDHIEAGTPTFERVREQIHERVYMERVQPALREYLAKLRDDAYIDIKSGYTDTGAGANQSTLVYATDSGPRTKEVRGKLGMGKKKTVVVTGEESRGASAAGSTSALGQAKAEAEAREKAVSERNSAEEAAAAKAAAEAAEQEKLSHMSNNEKKRYLAQKKKREADEAKDEAKRKRKEEQKQKEVAAKEAQSQAAEAKAANAAETKAAAKKAEEAKSAKNKKPAKENKNAKSKKPEKEPKEAESAQSSEQGETSQGKTSQQAESGEPPQKKKIHWF